MSAWPALPQRRICGEAPPNRCRARSAAGVSSCRTNPRPPTPGSRRSADRPALTGGKGVRSAAMIAGPDPVPLGAQVEPRLAVARVLVVHQRGGQVAVAVQERPLSRGQQVPEHGRRVDPLEAVLVQLEALDGLRGRGQRVEGAERVLHEVGVQLPVTGDRAADAGLGLQHQDRPAGIHQVVGGDQPVGPRAHHDRVVPAGDGQRTSHGGVGTRSDTPPCDGAGSTAPIPGGRGGAGIARAGYRAA